MYKKYIHSDVDRRHDQKDKSRCSHDSCVRSGFSNSEETSKTYIRTLALQIFLETFKSDISRRAQDQNA